MQVDGQPYRHPKLLRTSNETEPVSMAATSISKVRHQMDGIVPPSSDGWNVPIRPRDIEQYLKGEKFRWAYYIR